jgi:branched-chain amino acid transport system substrate-binding protein
VAFGGVCSGELRRYSLVSVAISWCDRLLEQPSQHGYVIAQTIVQVLKQCGDELTRERVMRQAANLKDFELGLLLPGIKINTSSNDYFPVEQMRMSKFNGEYGELFGPVISGEIKKE